MRTEKIIVRGELQPASSVPTSEFLDLEVSYRVRTTTRGAAERHEVPLNDDSIIEFVFDDDTSWICSPNTIDEVFPETTAVSRSAGEGVEIPLALSGDQIDRGLIGSILLKVVNVFTKKKLTQTVGHLAADLEKKQLEGKIGLFILDKNLELQKFTPETNAKPYLLFIHGTANNVKGSFSGLLGTPAWDLIHQSYDGRVLAFQHETLTKGPLLNTLDLVNALPKNCTLHLVTQSHGGHVGEILSRFCNQDANNLGFSDVEIKLLKDSGRKEEVDNINAIKKIVPGKAIRIEKFIRVACPAGGSTLASKRLDHFLNVVVNLIGTGSGPVGNIILGAFKTLIAAVLSSKNDPNILPGIESLNPQSPFIKVLNNPESSIDNSLIIISGNTTMKINLKALLVITTKLFFGHKNDMIVDTESMYAGTPRKGMVQFFIDEGTEIDHFHYYKNKRTQDALANAIKAKEDELIVDFRLVEGDLGGAKRGVFGLEGGQVFQNTVSGSKPILVVLPGIMGSNLGDKDSLVWINYLGFLSGNLKKLDIKNTMGAPSLIRTSYGKLVKHFSSDYDVVTFPFDWRVQLVKSAKKFSDTIEDLLKHNQPIKIIGHSMGGVLVRDFIVNNPNIWSKLNQSSGFRLIFLGAPLGGSYRIPSVLFGKDSIINTLAKVDLRHTKKDLLEFFARFPGILSLLPHVNDGDFSDQLTWTAMKDANGDSTWPIPETTDLKDWGAYRDTIKASLDEIDYTNATYIAGRDKATSCGYRIDKTGDRQELVFLSTAEGDQSVTWETGIPQKMIKDNSVYYVNATHGALANEPTIFDGIADILTNGSTTLLSKTRPSVRGDQKLFRSPEPVDFDLSPEGVEKSLLGLTGTDDKPAIVQQPLKVSVANGDLKYASFPLVAGHFNHDGILFAEKAINAYLKGALSERHQLGLYPGPIGTNEVLISSGEDFEGAIIVGLGDVGCLTSYLLAKTIEQGASKYLIQMNSKSFNGRVINGISSLIIGCGYGGLTIEDSINAVITGVNHANIKIKQLYGDSAQTVDCIEFVEQDKVKALTAFYALHRLGKNNDGNSLAVLEKKVIVERPGAVESTALSTSSEWWTRITAMQEKPVDNQAQDIRFNISSGGAREEQRILSTSTDIIEQLVNEISTENNWSVSKAKTVFELLIPTDFKEQVKKQNNIAWILDTYTASYPWELLQDSTENAQPLSVNAGMIRQLATQDYRVKINAATSNKALVIADPDLSGMISQLPGALKEGQSASSLFTSEGFDTTTMLRSTSGKIIEALFSADYKIIHLAGHGIYDPASPKRSGMVIGNNSFLSTREIKQMPTVPELVFVNCCYLGKINGGDEKYYQDRSKLAANIGTQLIQNGVKAVVVAGWAVDDAAALEFMDKFYRAMFDGYTFGEAVQHARASVYKLSGMSNNTWGAYQCYGDPYYKFTEGGHTKSKPYSFITTREALVALSNLQSELETSNLSNDQYLLRLENISKEIDERGLRDSLVTEKEAMVHADLYEYFAAIKKFRSLKADGFSLSPDALERYCSIRVKQCVINYGTNPKKVRAYLNEIGNVVEDFNGLLRLGETASRFAGLGATHKRKSLMQSVLTQKITAYVQMASFYRKAYTAPNNPFFASSLANWIEGEHLLVLLGKRKWGDGVRAGGKISYYLPASADDAIIELNKAKKVILNMPPDRMDYRNLVGVASIELCLNILKPSKTSVKELLALYKSIWVKAGTHGKKSSELEHFDFLIDAYQQLPKRKVIEIVNLVKGIREELDKLA
ncbi:MAG: CHAT domain-containing protein [Chryseolinea sp.]